jgi:hypothetical protein
VGLPTISFSRNSVRGATTTHTTAGLDIEAMVGIRFAARVSLGAASAARSAGELVVPSPLARAKKTQRRG